MRKEATVLTYFVVQSFQKGKKGGVLADTPVEARSAEAAVRMAERLASVTLGVSRSAAAAIRCRVNSPTP
jgi:hypothetical protein